MLAWLIVRENETATVVFVWFLGFFLYTNRTCSETKPPTSKGKHELIQTETVLTSLTLTDQSNLRPDQHMYAQ